MASPAGRIAATVHHLKSRIWLLSLLVGLCALYIYFGSAGHLDRWPVYGWFYDQLADGFRAGHLYLPMSPAPELLRAKNPYDSINSRYWPLDVSLYHGRYYIYWGPMPALLQALAKSVLGIQRSIGDVYAGVFSACLAGCAGALVVERMARRLFGSVSRPLLALCILAFACANPTLHMVSTTGTYQTAIISGQAWLLVGLLAAFDVVWHAGTLEARRWRMFAAGIGWAFALASRVTVLPAVAVLILLTALAEAWGSERRWSRFVVSALCLGMPVALSGAALLVYNQLRFQDWREFGLNVQLSAYPKMQFSTRYWLPNLYSYSLRPFLTSCQFPYFFQTWKSSGGEFPKWFPLPPDYLIDEPVIGWLRVIPLTWLSVFAFLLVPRPFSLRLRQSRTYLWCLLSFSTIATLSGLTALGVYCATMRYLSDVTSGLVLLGVLGAFALRVHRFGQKAPKLTSTAISVLASATVVMGLLIGYQGYNFHFHRENAELDRKLVKLLSVCGGRQPALPRYMTP